tara:strand:+ start:334 stop:588 length:255 start_codon:yes stop_codon:yes gene_type:complete
MSSQIKLSLFTLLLAFGCLYYLNLAQTQADILSDGIVRLEEGVSKGNKKLRKFNIEEMEEKIEDIENNLNNLKEILGFSTKNPS